jgi:PEP-CTERM motif
MRFLQVYKQVVAAACLVLAAAAPQAAVLFQQSPVGGGSDGEQSDGSTGPLSQSFGLGAGATLESIVWYGYHGANSGGALLDNFFVRINGTDVASGATLSSTSFDATGAFEVFQYTLDITDIQIGAAGSLDIANTFDPLNPGVSDTEWFWQYSDPNAGTVAFTLNGTRDANPVPLPATLPLALLGLAAAGWVSRSRKRALG